MQPYRQDLEEKSIEYSHKSKVSDRVICNLLDEMCDYIYIQGNIKRDKNSTELNFIIFDSEENKIIIKLDFLFGNIITDFSEADEHIKSGIRIYKADIQENLDINFDIIKDGNVLEVYLFEGKYNFTSMIYPRDGKIGIGIKAKDALVTYKFNNISE